MTITHFKKPPLSIEGQIALLISRGLVIQNQVLAKHYLKFISYYRFCGYGIEFENSNSNSLKSYKPGTSFEQILNYYVFDRKLRLLVINAIERIEIAVRTVITNELAYKYGAHWYLNRNLFLAKFKHTELISQIEKETFYNSQDERKRERFIQAYFAKYDEPKLPAIWMVAEILSLGSWSMIFANLANISDQKSIAKQFGIDFEVMKSWLHSLTYLRNLCAHHSKLWSRRFTLKPRVATNFQEQLKNNTSFAAQAAILKILIDKISPQSQWAYNLYKLMGKRSEMDLIKMDFDPCWHQDLFWNEGISWDTPGALTHKKPQKIAARENNLIYTTD